ncbi:2-amino-4-hydroxy-6-hydroxymethyldihydropteridine diphosphokinase [Desulfogranum mediterraneum]|uniref:2-amino-4-hydroxy-6- hydroxymethyldihydropteridine diphosphokinase n=1 Tax=Desulfogranum mediterraneum TaxID=160661 RepID=UPI0003F55AB1|nr:2-amino-4-hydroxy-6-hydroxymethyldihydropteridine diphosphokinase [Desulfogranum mediterraneum]
MPTPTPAFPHLAAISLGSNLGDSLATVHRAWQDLGAHQQVRPLSLSHPYRTEPVDMESVHWFINAAGILRTSLPAEGLLAWLQELEQRAGRRRSAQLPGHQDRTLDLDLLLFDQERIRSPSLVVPHPEMDGRAFVLQPLAEIAPELIHGPRGRSVGALLAELISAGRGGQLERLNWPAGSQREGGRNFSGSGVID